MKKNNRYLLLILLFFSISCNYSNLEKWRDDKKALNSYRNIENTNLLLKEYHIKDLTIDKIKKILGEPDKLMRIENVLYLQYYIENNCELKDKDCCLLTIVYSNNKANISISCM